MAIICFYHEEISQWWDVDQALNDNVDKVIVLDVVQAHISGEVLCPIQRS